MAPTMKLRSVTLCAVVLVQPREHYKENSPENLRLYHFDCQYLLWMILHPKYTLTHFPFRYFLCEQNAYHQTAKWITLVQHKSVEYLPYRSQTLKPCSTILDFNSNINVFGIKLIPTNGIWNTRVTKTKAL